MKILLIKRGAIGDLLMATPLIRQLKQRLNCDLDIIVGKSASIALTNNPYVDKTIIIPDQSFALKGVLNLSRVLLKLRGKYDYVFVLDKHWYFNWMAKLLGAPVIGYTRDMISDLALDKSVAYNDINRYQGMYYLDLLSASQLACADYTDLKLDLMVMTADKLLVEEFIFQNKLTNYIVIVNSGGNNAYEHDGIRMLPLATVTELVGLLLDRGHEVVLLGSGVDVNHYQKICASFPNGCRLFNLAGKFQLAASSYLILRAQHFYTTDCGAMHLGVAANVLDSMTAFFGPTNPTHFLPETWLSKVAVWYDENIYLPAYSLKGSRQNPTPEYFTHIELREHLH